MIDMRKRYKIADLTVEMDVSGRTALQAAPYAVEADGPADLRIRCDAAETLRMNPQLETEDDALYVGTGALFARRLPDFNGFQLHASAVSLDGRAYLFSAPSGTGKSTHTEKWCRLFGAEYLNDDKPALRQASGVWTVYGTPWSGKHDLSKPQGVPLGGIAFVERGENSIRRLAPAQALPLLMSQCARMLPRERLERFLTLADHLLRNTPAWMLTCRNEDAAAILSHKVMTGEEAQP